MPVIEVDNLTSDTATASRSTASRFAVEAGEIFGILGPNGAGKTTTVECIAGLRTPDGGTIRVLGLDPRRDRAQLRQPVGVQLQESQLPDQLTVREALELFASFYATRPTGGALIDELGLADSAEHAVRQALRRPEAAPVDRAGAGRQPARSPILDELTTGLDPQARRDTWDADRADPRPRRDGPAGHPLHGRGRAALRPGRRHRRRPGRRAGHPGRARRPGGDRPGAAVPPRAPGRPHGCSPACPQVTHSTIQDSQIDCDRHRQRCCTP